MEVSGLNALVFLAARKPVKQECENGDRQAWNKKQTHFSVLRRNQGRARQLLSWMRENRCPWLGKKWNVMMLWWAGRGRRGAIAMQSMTDAVLSAGAAGTRWTVEPHNGLLSPFQFGKQRRGSTPRLGFCFFFPWHNYVRFVERLGGKVDEPLGGTKLCLYPGEISSCWFILGKSHWNLLLGLLTWWPTICLCQCGFREVWVLFTSLLTTF